MGSNKSGVKTKKKKLNDGALKKGEGFTNYDRLLDKARSEGRVDGPFSCLLCGMRYMSKKEAVACCTCPV
ncbi:hypothetical protein HON36_02225 [Candidatus Parcubacteria bacterium]|jgi:hypothetical protein|nr:hypothetical protein [Candidatus Parcubacteria bacterium]MBT7227888.1 hypothetical protein [Candidatus Parcubacteria bacterium]